MKVKVMVAAENAAGIPDFFWCVVQCTDEEYDTGKHYVRAEEAAEDDDFRPMLSFDENDDGGQRIVDTFNWKQAKTFKV